MQENKPLRSKPLCFLDPPTLYESDVVSVGMGTLGVVTLLRENPDHQFYYFPDIMVDEVVLFSIA